MKNYLSHSFWKIYTAGKKICITAGDIRICRVSLSHLIVMLVMVVSIPWGDWIDGVMIVTWSEENKQGVLLNRRLFFFNL